MKMEPNPSLKPGLGKPICPLPSPDARWVALAEAASEANPFYAPDMLRAALDHLDQDKAVRVIEVFDGGQLIGLMPVVITSRHGRLPMSNVTNWMHPHCFFGAPIIHRGDEIAAWAGFLSHLDAADWAPHFLHVRGLDSAGANVAALNAVCKAQVRPCYAIGHYDRALLQSDLPAEAYWDANVRSKKRKEIRRLQKRLSDLGTVESRTLTDPADLPDWCDDFLRLESSGWKGQESTALSCSPSDAAFFRAATAAALATGHLHLLRIDLDGQAIAMLANFRHLDGAFSFKIAIDETLGRFSPGVLIEIDNLRAVQDDPTISWMDSCATPDHPMIDSLWSERRNIAQYRVALRGSGIVRARRAAAFALANGIEHVTTFVRGR